MTRTPRFRTAATSTVLVVGAPRSGTTMVTSLLGAHREVGMVAEDTRLTFTRISGKPVVGNKLCIPTQIQFDRRSTLLKRMTRAVIARLLGEQRSNRVRRLHPESHYSIEDYLALPGLHVVGVLRGHDAVVRSNMARAGHSSRYATSRWESAVLTLERISRDERFELALVDYDSIVADPTEGARRLCEFIGLEYDATMLEGVTHNPIYHGRHGISQPQQHAATDAIPPPSVAAAEAHRRLLARRLV